MVQDSGKTISEILDGRKAIFIYITAGGDFTPEGDFASPVQLAFYFDGQKLSGRLPQIQVSSNLYKMFGDDYLGVSTDTLFSHAKNKYIANNDNKVFIN